MKNNSTSNNEKTFKESLEELYGQSISEQEAFNAQYDLSELLKVLDEVDGELTGKSNNLSQETNLQGGVK